MPENALGLTKNEKPIKKTLRKKKYCLPKSASASVRRSRNFKKWSAKCMTCACKSTFMNSMRSIFEMQNVKL